MSALSPGLGSRRRELLGQLALGSEQQGHGAGDQGSRGASFSKGWRMLGAGMGALDTGVMLRGRFGGGP